MVRGSSAPPRPSLAARRTQMAAPWQPTRRHLCLRARGPRGAAGNRTLRAGGGGVGGKPAGEAARGHSTRRIWGTPRGRHPFPLQGATGMRWDAGGHYSSSGSAGTGTPPNLGGILEPQGSSRHFQPRTGVRADAETPNAQPHAGEGRAGASRHSHPGPSEQDLAKGSPGRGTGAPHVHPTTQGWAAHPRQRWRVLPAQ